MYSTVVARFIFATGERDLHRARDAGMSSKSFYFWGRLVTWGESVGCYIFFARSNAVLVYTRR